MQIVWEILLFGVQFVIYQLIPSIKKELYIIFFIANP